MPRHPSRPSAAPGPGTAPADALQVDTATAVADDQAATAKASGGRDPQGRFLRRRKNGGQPGNLNATRHPWRAFWRRRALKPEDRWIVPVLEAYAAELVDDKGGPEQATAGERRLAEIAQTARGAAMLILAEAARSGFIATDPDTGTWDLQPGVKELSRFLGLERSALGDLGLERRAKEIPSLSDYLQKRTNAAPVDVPAKRVDADPGQAT